MISVSIFFLFYILTVETPLTIDKINKKIIQAIEKRDEERLK
jgi:hypothetical protein